MSRRRKRRRKPTPASGHPSQKGMMVPVEANLAAPNGRQGSPDTREIATIAGGRDITRPYIDPLGQLLLPQDEILLLKGGLGHEAYKVFEKALQDDQAKMAMGQRLHALTECEWEVSPGKRHGASITKADRMGADYLEDQLTNHTDWDNTTEKMGFGLWYGYSIAEMLYARDGRWVCLNGDRKGIRVRHRRRFRFDYDGKPKLITNQNPLGEELPDLKFWHLCVGGDNDDDPYGRGLAHWAYWPIWFKRNALKFWLFFLEKFGMPTAKGKYRQGTPKTEQDKLLSCLYAILTDGGIILPDDMEIELLEARRSGTADYSAVYDRMDAAIAKIVLGQTMTSENGAARSQAEVHERVRQMFTKADDNLISESFNNGPVRWLIDYNRAALGDCAYPTVRRLCEPGEDLNDRAKREVDLKTVGFRLTSEKFAEIFGEGYERVQSEPGPSAVGSPNQNPVGAQSIAPGDPPPTDLPQPPLIRGVPEAGGSEAEMAAPADTVDLLLPQLQRQAAPAMQGMIATLRDQWERFKGQENGLIQFQQYLDRAYTDLDSEALEVALSQFMTTARYAGIYEAQEGE